MSDLTLKVGRVIDGIGGLVVERGLIEIEAGRIARIGSWGERLRPGTEVIDLSECTAMPGLIDAHVHYVSQQNETPSWQLQQWPETLQILRASAKARSELALGITSARDLGAPGTVSIVLKRAIEMGIVAGPRMVVCGQILCATGGHYWLYGREVDGPDAMRIAVRQMFKLGADIIKLMCSGGIGVSGPHPVFPWETQVIADTVQQELTEPEIRIAVEEAHKIGRRVTAHAYGMTAIGAALAAGVDCIEHGIWLDERGAAFMAEHNVSYVPTLSAIQTPSSAPQWVIDRAARAVAAHRETVARARAAGVRIAAGADVSGELRREMELLVEAGLSNDEAVIAATRAGAEVLGLDSVTGTLTPGKWADILVVKGDPHARISDVRNVRLVLKAGEIVSDVSTPVMPTGLR